jgi:hypothetical protein
VKGILVSNNADNSALYNSLSLFYAKTFSVLHASGSSNNDLLQDDAQNKGHERYITYGLKGAIYRCGRNNSHVSKNHCGDPKAGSGKWSVPLGRVHNKVFSRRHAVVG